MTMETSRATVRERGWATPTATESRERAPGHNPCAELCPRRGALCRSRPTPGAQSGSSAGAVDDDSGRHRKLVGRLAEGLLRVVPVLLRRVDGEEFHADL